MAEKKYLAAEDIIAYLEKTANPGENAYTRADIALKLLKMPTANITEIKCGHWIICSDGYYPYCSECKEEPPARIMTDYCPLCGARMDGGNDNG